MPPLRFGIMAASRGLNRFACSAVDNLLRDGLAEPVVMIIDSSEARPSSMIQKLKKAVRFDGNLWHFQNKLFPPGAIDAYQVGQSDYGNLPHLTCTPVTKGRWSQYFGIEDVERLRSYRLDFILKFAFGIIRGEILDAARFGVWSWHHDDEDKYRGGPPALWEIVKGDQVTGALLQRLTERLDGGVVLKKCSVPTDGLSYRRNLQRIQESSAHMARWVCLDIRAGRIEDLEAPPSRTRAPIYRAPNDWQMLKFWSRLILNRVRHKIDNQRVEVWNVGLIHEPPQRFLDETYQPQIEWSEYTEAEQFVADPFLIPTEGRTRILAEEFQYFNEQGRIVEMRRGEDGKISVLIPAIDTGIHMSYPYVIEYQGSIYAIPESGDAREIRLYQLDPSTGQWSFARNLITNVDAIDSTVFEDGGNWWLMHSRISGIGPWSLYVWSAPSLFGPWSPHPGNPVKTDVQSTRPAGKPFRYEGCLYRPAQDGRQSYGGAMTINRIDVISDTEFRETVVRWIRPDPKGPYPDGIHTLSGWGNQSVVDGKRHRWSMALIADHVRRKLTGRKPIRPFRHSGVKVLSHPAESSVRSKS